MTLMTRGRVVVLRWGCQTRGRRRGLISLVGCAMERFGRRVYHGVPPTAGLSPPGVAAGVFKCVLRSKPIADSG